tara:strand:+ start:1005 stop:1688 length:684 start_codon:yes stop_codon:yes gene_type:complete
MTDNKVQYGVFQWGPCVMQIKISEEFRKLLLEESAKARKQANDYRSKLAGIIKEEYSFENKEKFLPWISQCLGIYDEAFQKFKNVRYKPEDKPKYLLSAMWVNYMKKHEFNPPHDHSDELSFVIFLDVPEELQKEQKEFVGNSGGPGSLGFLYGEGNRQSITYQAVVPQNGHMFIFPAWLKHYVAPFYSDVTRISVAGNVANSINLKNLEKHHEEKKTMAPEIIMKN